MTPATATPVVRLFTFGAGAKGWHDAVGRLEKQASQFFDIDEVRGYTASDLPEEYHCMFPGFPERYRQGFGLYSWKPFLTYHLLASDAINEDDVLIYVDAGCELNIHAQTRFAWYLSHTAKYSALFFQLEHPNRYWTKYDERLYTAEKHFFRNQIMASSFFLRKSRDTMDFAEKWLQLCAQNDGELLKDPDGSTQQLAEFVEHRHDQSCLSTVVYDHGFEALPDETYFDNWRDGADYPILAMRNASARSVLGQARGGVIGKTVKFICRRFSG